MHFWTAFLFLWGTQASLAAPPVDHVIVISVDGLRGDAITALGRSRAPGLFELLDDGGTLDARCDANYPLTLPNHTSMVTGRPVLGKVGHHWIGNKAPAPGATYHEKRTQYVASMFDVAHDDGVKTALFAGKVKFELMDRSWSQDYGAPDKNGTDNGRDKIDEYVMNGDSSVLTDKLLEMLHSGADRSLSLIHYRDPDAAGHKMGWDMTPGSAYLRSIVYVDRYIVALLSFLKRRPALRAKTAILLTSDHGGGVPFRSHTDASAREVYAIPFLAWVGGHGQKGDLYAWSRNARKAWEGNPSQEDTPPPIRNGDIGNAALFLLGLPAIPGSVHNAQQDLILHTR